MSREKIQSNVLLLRKLRLIHRWLGIPLIIFFFIIGATSILLAWKKKAELLPPTLKTKVEQVQDWKSTSSLMELAQEEMVSRNLDPEIDRLDYRPDKGVVKVTFTSHFTEVQLDGYTGEILSVATRHSDWIEKVHDGSIVDYYFGQGEGAKLTYSSLTAFGLILMSFTGFYLWFFPKKIRKLKNKASL